ncbi:MAG TPA: hypothetical protein ENH23_03995 [candidate division Zixibacteria bacterium]|nr:hypothetical protein [candidate division Zixibacteria bacterium]
MISMIIGTIGVLILLVAFGLNISHKLSENSTIYLSMNIIGSLMAAWYAYAGGVYPFIALEIVWALTAFVRLLKVYRENV